MKSNNKQDYISNKKENRKESQRRNEIIINRLMIVFVLAVALIACLIFICNITVGSLIKLTQMMPAILVILGVLAGASLVYLLIMVQRHADERMRTITSKNLACVMVFLFLIALGLYWRGHLIAPVLLATTIAAALLCFIYYLYQREFMCFSVLTAIGCFLLFYAKNPIESNSAYIAVKVILTTLPVIVAAATFFIKKNGGYIGDKNLRGVKIFEGKSAFSHIYILCVALFAGGVLSFTALNFLALYLMFAVLAYFLAVGIIYTIKLM